MSEKMREEFETWAANYRDGNGLPHFTLRRPDGEYVDGTTELCWRGWKASRESLAIELPPTITVEEAAEAADLEDESACTVAHMVNGAITACGSFIKAAGVQVKP